MEAFGIVYLLSSFVLADFLIKLFVIIGVSSLVLYVGGILAMMFVTYVIDPISARRNEKPSQRMERLRMRELDRKRRIERIKHPFSF